MAKVRLSPKADAELTAIAEYIAHDSPLRAKKVVDEVRQRCGELKTLPLRGRKRPEFAPGVRSFVVRPFVVFYAVAASGDVEILRIIDGRRDLATVYFSPLVKAA
jgi:toxin ParE1/3/4